MTKKKGKKCKYLGAIAAGIACLFALAAILMIFLPAFTAQTGDSTISFKGTQAAFGYTKRSKVPILGTIIETEILKANMISMFAYLLPIVGIVLSILTIAYKRSMVIGIISAGIFILSAILAFASISTFPDQVIGNEYIALSWKYGIGTILSGVFSLLAGGLMCGKVLFKK